MVLPPDIALCERTYDPAVHIGWPGLLSDEERRRVATFAHEGRRHGFVAGRVAARELLAERLGVAPRDVPLDVSEGGALDVTGTGLHVSIAHSGARAVAVVASRPVGVDLERIRPRHPELARFILHPDERALPASLPYDRTRALILCWALKEATLKALRTGLRLSPKRLRLDVDAAAGAAIVAIDGAIDGAIDSAGCWQARFEEQDDFFLAVAFPGD